jgi:Uma2 family endonuclease
MGMPQTVERWTAERVRALPDDGNRYEVVAGELLVTPAPTFDHQDAVLRMVLRLREYLETTRIGYAAFSPADIEFDVETLVQPDVFVVPLVEGKRPRRWVDVDTLVLALEVLSPSTARADRTVKRRLFQRVGVPEYWIVDLDARLVERWRPREDRPEIVAETLVWQPAAAHPPLTIELPAFFTAVLGP